MPQLVSYVEYKKGTYYADQGDFSTAGSYNIYYRNTIAPAAFFGVGDFGYNQFFTAASHPAGAGNFLYAIEVYHDNGSFVKPDEYNKYSGVFRYSVVHPKTSFTATASAYNGNFDSSDQIPQRLVYDGVLSRFGYVDPTDGGTTSYFTLSSHYSNFTYDFYDASNYYNETANPITCNTAYKTCVANVAGQPRAPSYSSYCPAYTAPAGAAPGSLAPIPYDFQCGHQREQLDNRFFERVNLTRTFETTASTTTVGAGTTEL